MATKTFNELKQLAIQIRDEKTNKQNTANRVGAEMLEAINKLEQDYYDKTNIDEQAKNTTQSITNLNTKIDKRTTEYNVSVNNPTSGTNGSNKYDLSTAIGQVPAELRVAGLKVSFLNSAGKPESWKYQGGSWAVANFIQESAGGNKILTWVTDAATTRKQVSANERKAGMQISYKNNAGNWVNEQYIGTYLYDSEWIKDSNWLTIADEIQLEEIQAITENSIDSLKNGVDIQFENINIGQITDGQMIQSGVVKPFTGRASSDLINIEKYQGSKLTLNYCGGFQDSQAYAFYDNAGNYITGANQNATTLLEVFVPLNAVNMRISCKTANIEKVIVIQTPKKTYGTNDLSFVIDVQKYLQKRASFLNNYILTGSGASIGGVYAIKLPCTIITRIKVYIPAGGTVKVGFSGVLDSFPNMMLPIKQFSFTNSNEEGTFIYDINLSLSQYKEAYMHFVGGCRYDKASPQYPGSPIYAGSQYGDGADPNSLVPYANGAKYNFSVDLEYLIDPEEEKENPETMVLSDAFRGKDYVSYGDSITAGAKEDETGSETYGLNIAKYFGFVHINKGVSGSVPISSSNLSDANLEAVTENTRLVTISGGQNKWVTAEDINSEDRSTSIGAINYYIDQIRLKSPKCVIILCPTYIGNGDSQCPKDYQRIADNKHVGLAPTLDLHLIDWEGDKAVNLLRYDNVHFTAFGAKKFAAVVREYARQFFF